MTMCFLLLFALSKVRKFYKRIVWARLVFHIYLSWDASFMTDLEHNILACACSYSTMPGNEGTLSVQSILRFLQLEEKA